MGKVMLVLTTQFEYLDVLTTRAQRERATKKVHLTMWDTSSRGFAKGVQVKYMISRHLFYTTRIVTPDVDCLICR